MASVFVLNAADSQFVGHDGVILARLPLGPGDYLVLAKGEVQVTSGEIHFSLSVGGQSDETRFTHHAPSGPFIDGRGTFSLAVAVNLQSGPAPSTVLGGILTQSQAMLSASASSEGGGGSIRNVRIIAFQVDTLEVTTI